MLPSIEKQLAQMPAISPLFLIREWLGWDDLEKEEEYKESH